jgi:hypothetical protein
MKPFIFPLLLSLILVSPTGVSADNKFATIEITSIQSGQVFIASLSASGDIKPNQDNFYVFPGYVMAAKGGATIPLRVLVPQNLILSITSDTRNEQYSVERVFQFKPEITGVDVRKTFYSILVRQGESQAVMALTDDPLPVIAWIIVGGVTTTLGSLAIFVHQCKSVEMIVEGVTKDSAIKFHTKCGR